MPVYQTFTRRRDRAAKPGGAEVYVYDHLPDSLVNQIMAIWEDVLGNVSRFQMGQSYLTPESVWATVEDVIVREYGFRSLPHHAGDYASVEDRVLSFFENTNVNDHRLDVIEIVFRMIARSDIEDKQAGIDELNERFKLAGVGYQFAGKDLIRMDSTVAHAEMVKPALVLLGRKGFEKADEQYRSAHKHYRHKEYPQAITEAGRAFESALKAICKQKKWTHQDGDRLSELVKVVVSNGLFPDWLDNSLTTYIAMIKTGLPSVRNNSGAHGESPDAEPVQDYFTRYALHMSAANILLVAEAADKI
jgi:hypothetical protein